MSQTLHCACRIDVTATGANRCKRRFVTRIDLLLLDNELGCCVTA